MFFFHSDGRLLEDSAHFLKVFNQEMCRLPTVIMDEQKIEALEDYLAARSPADNWYQGLNTTQLTTWAALVTEFEKRWPSISLNHADEDTTARDEISQSKYPHMPNSTSPLDSTLALEPAVIVSVEPTPCTVSCTVVSSTIVLNPPHAFMHRE